MTARKKKINAVNQVACVIRKKVYHMSKDPIYDHSKWQSIGELMADLFQNKTPAPYWINFGQTRHRITEETREQVARGILIAMEYNQKEINFQTLQK